MTTRNIEVTGTVTSLGVITEGEEGGLVAVGYVTEDTKGNALPEDKVVHFWLRVPPTAVEYHVARYLRQADPDGGYEKALADLRAVRSRIVLPAGDYTEVFVMADEDGNGVIPHFECSICGWVVDDVPCPSHAPLTDLPGLRLLDCEASPRHWTWAHQREDYGLPCPWCLRADQAARDAEARQCRHWPWRRWWVTHWLVGVAYVLGVISGSRVNLSGDGHAGCIGGVRLGGSRPYVLGVDRDTWRCWLRGHRRGAAVALGFCGKCLPWPCCGSTLAEHDLSCLAEVETAAGEAGYVLTDAGREALAGWGPANLAEIAEVVGQGVSWEQIATDEWDGEPCFEKAPVDGAGEAWD